MENNDVKQDTSPAVSPDVQSEPVVETATTTTSAPAKGSKTPDSNLYAAVEEERRIRKDAERRAKEAEEQLAATSNDIYSDEGKTLKKYIEELEGKFNSIQEERELDGLKSKFPAIKDKWEDFSKFKEEYPRHKLENVAKIFLAENNLLEEVPTRIGLERPVAGPKSPQPSGMNAEDVANLRKNNYKKYLEMITSGKLRPEDIR